VCAIYINTHLLFHTLTDCVDTNKFVGDLPTSQEGKEKREKEKHEKEFKIQPKVHQKIWNLVRILLSLIPKYYYKYTLLYTLQGNNPQLYKGYSIKKCCFWCIQLDNIKNSTLKLWLVAIVLYFRAKCFGSSIEV